MKRDVSKHLYSPLLKALTEQMEMRMKLISRFLLALLTKSFRPTWGTEKI